MRIGRSIIDLDAMSVEDLTIIIDAARAARKRKQQAANLQGRMSELLNEAHDAGFDFIDKDFGNVIRPVDIEIHDNQ